jgi:glutamate synthase (NADPH/NADH) small chain
VRVVGEGGRVTGVVFQKTELDQPATRTGPVRGVPGTEFTLPADMVIKALGQEHLLELLCGVPGLQLDRGTIVVDRATGRTSVPRLFAGGDCLRNGGEVVDAVQDGKVAAWGIHAMFTAH